MLAVIVKGNPKFINNPLAKAYYAEIEDFLKSRGYSVEYDSGKDYTRPRQDADIYVAHSRGTDRFRFMEPNNQKKFLMFGSLDGVIHPVDAAWQQVTKPGQGTPPKEHFLFTGEQKQALDKLISADQSITAVMVREALAERYLGQASLNKHMENITPIAYKGQVVGFHVPFQEPDGVWRVGSIYIRPKFRGKGLAVDVIRSFSKDKRVRAWIEPSNAKSIRAFTSAGMVKTDRQLKVNGKPFEEYVSFKESFEKRIYLCSSI